MERDSKIILGLVAGFLALIAAGVVVSSANGERWDRACAAAGGVRVTLGGAYACAKLELLPVKVTP